MSNSITQDMAFRQSLMQYAQKYGVSRASRKYNKSRSYIYFWKKRWDGSVASLACASRRPHSHPNQHTEDELKLIRDMRRRNPKLGMLELWHRLRQRGYSRCPESLFRVMRKLGLFPAEKPKKKYLERSTFYDRKKEAVMLLGIALWGYAIPAFRGIFDVEGDESEIPEFFANTEKSDLCPT